MRYALIAVEGWGDVEFILASLRLLKISRAMEKTGPEAGFWQPLIPQDMPKHEKLWRRLQIPCIVQSEEVSVAVHFLNGKPGLDRFNTLLYDKEEIVSELAALGIIVDKDQEPVQDCVDHICTALSYARLLPMKAGEVLTGAISTGIYVIPNNNDSGALEDVLMLSGEAVYPELLRDAGVFVAGNDGKYKDPFNTPLHDKAVISAAAAILQPGSSSNVSIKKDKWVSQETYQNAAMVRQFVDFLADLLDVPRFQPQVAPTPNPAPPSAES